MAHPLFLKSVLQEKIWGGKCLKEAFGYELPSEKIGEYWAISAHPNGASVIENGPFAGQALDKVYAEHRELFGNSKEPVFPLLTKILDANEWLSVQVHPDDTYGLANEGELGKTECWYVIAADEGAEIVYGHQARSKEELRQMIEEGKWDDLLIRIPVKTGDFFYVPSGTMHAIGKGILILETQQSSDTTYRVYDFDRKDADGNLRELHIDQSVDVMTIGEVANSHPDTIDVAEATLTTFVSNEFFTVYKWDVHGKIEMNSTADYYLCSVLNGKGSIEVDGEIYPLEKGMHFILPSDCKKWEFQGQLELIVSHP